MSERPDLAALAAEVLAILRRADATERGLAEQMAMVRALVGGPLRRKEVSR